jgi:hypothetical protein
MTVTSNCSITGLVEVNALTKVAPVAEARREEYLADSMVSCFIVCVLVAMSEMAGSSQGDVYLQG